MQLLKHLTALLLCAAGASALPSGYDTASTTPEEPTDSLAARDTPTLGTELQFWNSQPGAPSGGLGLGQYLFQGTLPRDKSGDAAYPELIVKGMNAAGANHHYLIGVIVADKTTGPKNKKVTTREASSVVAWDIAVKDADTMVLQKAASEWKRALATKVKYTYLGKAKSDTAPAISKIGTAATSSYLPKLTLTPPPPFPSPLSPSIETAPPPPTDPDVVKSRVSANSICSQLKPKNMLLSVERTWPRRITACLLLTV